MSRMELVVYHLLKTKIKVQCRFINFLLIQGYNLINVFPAQVLTGLTCQVSEKKKFYKIDKRFLHYIFYPPSLFNLHY